MIEIRCKSGETIQVGDQGIVQIIRIDSDRVVVQVTARKQLETRQFSPDCPDLGWEDFRHSE